MKIFSNNIFTRISLDLWFININSNNIQLVFSRKTRYVFSNQKYFWLKKKKSNFTLQLNNIIIYIFDVKVGSYSNISSWSSSSES